MEKIEQLVQLLPEGPIRQMAEQQPIAIAAAIAVVILTILLLLVTKLFSGGSKGAKAVLVGPCNAGKTILFYQLRDGSTNECGTVASMQENEASVTLQNAAGKRGGAAVQVVDVPGHERLRHKLEAHLHDARAIVFVVDAADITPSKVCIIAWAACDAGSMRLGACRCSRWTLA